MNMAIAIHFLFFVFGVILGAVLARARDIYKDSQNGNDSLPPNSLVSLISRLFSSIDQIIRFRFVLIDEESVDLWKETKIPFRHGIGDSSIEKIVVERLFPPWVILLPIFPLITAWLIAILITIIFQNSIVALICIGGVILLLYPLFFLVIMEPWQHLILADGSERREIYFVNNKMMIDKRGRGFLFEDLDLSQVDYFKIKTVYLNFTKRHSEISRVNAIFICASGEEHLYFAVSKYFDDRFGNQVDQICKRLNSTLTKHRGKFGQQEASSGAGQPPIKEDSAG